MSVLWLVGGFVLAGIGAFRKSAPWISAAAGCGAAALASRWGAPVAFQVLIAAGTALIVYFYVRPPVLRFFFPEKGAAEVPVPALVGRIAVVAETLVGSAQTPGCVVVAGRERAARTNVAGPLRPGTRVIVERIDGDTLIVAPKAP